MKASEIKVGDKVKARSVLTWNTYEGTVSSISGSSIVYDVDNGTMSFPKNANKRPNLSIEINGEILV